MLRWALVLGLGGCSVIPTLDETDPPWDGWPSGDTRESSRLRIATWNVEGLDAPGSIRFEAVRAILDRLDADVVGLNEIDVDARDNVRELAEDLGYDVVVVADDSQFGEAGNALLARIELVASELPTAAELSGDPSAFDVTRRPVVGTFRVPVSGQSLTVVSQHWKSGDFDDIDVFRRSVDAIRTAQAIGRHLAADMRVVMGDANAELGLVPAGPERFTSQPPGAPFSFRLGSDVADLLAGDGLLNDAFGPIEAQGLSAIGAVQRDGEPATRPDSGRRLDYVFVNDAVAGSWVRSEVYNSRHDALPGIADGGDPVGFNDSNHASDHLPVLVELRVVETDGG
ncbi:MAG TPA: endonuclease/exonuclease/phosphatase family protein [Myxococcota bacterium]|nr:endonuclease/exonuclease/phosphatase family protein [Myxococcota bacterium]